MTFGAMVENHVKVEFLGDAVSCDDVVSLMSMGTRLYFAFNKRQQSFELNFAFLEFFGFFAFEIILCFHEPFANYSGCAHSGAGEFLLFAIHTFWIFAKSELHAGAFFNYSSFSDIADHFYDAALAANWIRRAWSDHGSSNTTAQSITKSSVSHFQRIKCSHLWGGEAKRLIKISVIPANALFFKADVSVGINKARKNILITAVYDCGTGFCFLFWCWNDFALFGLGRSESYFSYLAFFNNQLIQLLKFPLVKNDAFFENSFHEAPLSWVTVLLFRGAMLCN
ncbi:MAG: hypothetical protein ACD_39C00625G0004 [uncultured bacterium]|nr:MAG: hypothetical protein ACD_39C00625G0004 [uncultured bacterium]